MRLLLIPVAVVLFLLVPVVAIAAPELLEDPQGFIGALLEAISSSNWRVVGALGIMGAVAALREWGPAVLSSGKAAWITSIAIGAVLGLAGGLLAPGAIGGVIGVLGLLLNGAITGFAASGLYSGGKKILEEK